MRRLTTWLGAAVLGLGFMATATAVAQNPDRNTQQNAAMVEEATAAAESLRAQAAQRVQALERLRL